MNLKNSINQFSGLFLKIGFKNGQLTDIGLRHLAKHSYMTWPKLILTNKMNGAELESCQVR